MNQYWNFNYIENDNDLHKSVDTKILLITTLDWKINFDIDIKLEKLQFLRSADNTLLRVIRHNWFIISQLRLLKYLSQLATDVSKITIAPVMIKYVMDIISMRGFTSIEYVII